jgi:inosine/xanthosine triphosphatase
MMHIIVGSQNPVKLNAVRSVFKPVYPDAAFSSLDVQSGVSDQPWGNAETRQGAYNRARAALAGNTEAHLAVGLEGGVQETEFGLFTCAWCVVLDQSGRVGVGGSACTQLPDAVANDLKNGLELGQAMDALSGQHNTKQNEGAIGLLTDGLLTRQSAYEAIIKMALSPFRRPQWYAIKDVR